MPRPNGFMLIELTVVMATLAALMGIATALVFLFVRCQETARENLRVTAVRAGLTEQFRRDAHAARKAEAEPPNRGRTSAWRLDLADDRAVVYQARPGGLLRRETLGAAVVAEEIYRLPGDADVSIDRLEEGRLVLLRLRIAPSAPPGEPAIRPMVIDAALGLEDGWRGDGGGNRSGQRRQ